MREAELGAEPGEVGRGQPASTPGLKATRTGEERTEFSAEGSNLGPETWALTSSLSPIQRTELA